MPEFDLVVIGAGAAGVAAARQLTDARLSVLVVEARSRIGGRAWTWCDPSGLPLDLGCGWLHSANENEWSAVASKLGFVIDRTPPPWSRAAVEVGFPATDQRDFRASLESFYARLHALDDGEADRPAAALLEPGCRWNPLINAISSFVNGTELDHVSAHDWARYHDTGVNWRVVDGYGALVQAYAAGLDIKLDCPATIIDHAGPRVRVETAGGAVTARAAIITVPTSVIACEALRFAPGLPEKTAAADALPLGLDDKLFLRVDAPDDLPAETRLFGATDRAGTGSYHLRPFGRPIIEVYFGGALARQLETAGNGAFAQFATDELAARLGNAIRKRLAPVAVSAWGRDPYARGAYSYARIGHAGARATLAAPVNDRLFFAGEATSPHHFSTAHGAYRSGLRAAAEALKALAERADSRSAWASLS